MKLHDIQRGLSEQSIDQPSGISGNGMVIEQKWQMKKLVFSQVGRIMIDHYMRTWDFGQLMAT